MQAKRSELTALIVSLGGTEKIVKKLDRRKFLFRVGNIPKLEQEPDFKVPDGDLGKLYAEVCESVAAKEKIELLPEDKEAVMNGEAPHAKKPPKEGKKATKVKPIKPAKASKNGEAHGRRFPLKPGPIEITYKGKDYKVVAGADGTITYGSKKFTSLTAAAKSITGAASISGPRFFGLVTVGAK